MMHPETILADCVPFLCPLPGLKGPSGASSNRVVCRAASFPDFFFRKGMQKMLSGTIFGKFRDIFSVFLLNFSIIKVPIWRVN